jgi:hypothetical protein
VFEICLGGQFSAFVCRKAGGAKSGGTVRELETRAPQLHVLPGGTAQIDPGERAGRFPKRSMRSTSFPRASSSMPVTRRTKFRRSSQACRLRTPFRDSRTKLAAMMASDSSQARTTSVQEKALDHFLDLDHGIQNLKGGRLEVIAR